MFEDNLLPVLFNVNMYAML